MKVKIEWDDIKNQVNKDEFTDEEIQFITNELNEHIGNYIAENLEDYVDPILESIRDEKSVTFLSDDLESRSKAKELLRQFAKDCFEAFNFDEPGYNYQSTRGYKKLLKYINRLEKRKCE